MSKLNFSIKEALSTGFKIFFRNFFFIIGVLFVAWLTLFISIGILKYSAAFIFLNDSWSNAKLDTILNAMDQYPLAKWAFNILFFYPIFGILAGGMRIKLDMIRGKQASIKSLFSCFSVSHKLMGLSLIMIVLVAFGTLLFIIPGIFIFCRCYFSWHFVVDKNMSIMQAMKESYRLTKGLSFKFFAFNIVTRMLDIFVVPIIATNIAADAIYNKLDQERNKKTEVDALKAEKSKEKELYEFMYKSNDWQQPNA